MFGRAVAYGSTFAEAYALLAQAHVSMYTYDSTPERLARAREAADRTLALDPESPDAHLALGQCAHQVSDYRPRDGHGRRHVPSAAPDEAHRESRRGFPVVVVTGARQPGKTTLVQRMGGGRTYLTLDDLDVLEIAPWMSPWFSGIIRSRYQKDPR